MRDCRCIVRGRVQGVWFRKFTKEVAERLGISGEVRNLSDGSVEVKASVGEESWEEFIKALKKGPPLARVDSIEIEPIQERFSGGFRIVR